MWFAVLVGVSLSVEVLSYLTGGEYKPVESTRQKNK